MKKKVLLIAAGSLALLLVVVVVLAFSLGSLIRKAVETVGPQATGAPVKMARCTLNPVTGTVAVGWFVLGNPPGFAGENAFVLASGKVRVSVGSLLSDTVVVKSVRIEGAEVTWDGLGGDNLRRIAANAQAFADKMGGGGKGGGKEPAGKQKKVIIDDLLLTGTLVHLYVGGKSMGTVPIPEIHLTGIGRESGGATAGEAISKVTSEIVKGAGSAVSKGAASLGNLGGKGVDAVGEKAKGLIDLFK